MKKILLTLFFVVGTTFILMLLLKLASFPGITWAWVLLPIAGPLVIWFIFLGAVTTVGLIWPTPPKVPDYFKPGNPGPVVLKQDKYRVEKLRVSREIPPEDSPVFQVSSDGAKVALKDQYYRKAIALELATLAHDTPGFIEWDRRENHIVGELKILVNNEHA